MLAVGRDLSIYHNDSIPDNRKRATTGLFVGSVEKPSSINQSFGRDSRCSCDSIASSLGILSL